MTIVVDQMTGDHIEPDAAHNGAQPDEPTHPVRVAAYHSDHVDLFHADCMAWLSEQEKNSIHGVVTDPPYSFVEYSANEQHKLRNGNKGIWRLPSKVGGYTRLPVPRFTILKPSDVDALLSFYERWARALLPVLVPGGHVLIASQPLLSFTVTRAVAGAGFERRGEIVRLVNSMRGGDRPKGAHDEFAEVTVIPRGAWEPWLLFRKPLEGRVQDNLRVWGTGGLRRLSKERPFTDVIRSHPAGRAERAIAPHPSIKPQAFIRQLVRAILPTGEGTVLDPFAGSGSTLAAAEYLGYRAIGVEIDSAYVTLAKAAIPRLAVLDTTPARTRQPRRHALEGP